MPRPHLKLQARDFPTNVLAVTNHLFDAKPWRLDLGQLDLYQGWADDVCDEYDVGPVGVQKVDRDVLGFGYEPGAIPNIILGRYSLTTLFCAVGAHINVVEGRTLSDIAHIEWGYSLFYVVRPVMFRRRVREGRIVGLTAKDTFSLDTWRRLETMGLTVGDFLVDSRFDIRTLDAEDDLTSPDDEAEAAEADEDISNVITLSFAGRDANSLRELPIITLRQMSRGHFSGGYSMTKEQLVRELVAHGVTRSDV